MTTDTKRALIVVDVQNDFADEDGSLYVEGGTQVASRLRKLMTDHRYDAVLTTQDWHIAPGDHWSDTPDYKDSWPVHGKAGSWGAELHPLIQGVPASEHFFKGQRGASYSGFDGVSQQDPIFGGVGTDLYRWLQERGVTEVDVVGLATDYCVKATAIDAAKLGFTTHVLVPYTAAVSPEGEQAAWDEMSKAGVDVVQVTD